MSASHRKLCRLPLEVFDDLLVSMQGVESTTTSSMTPQDLRSAICEKLKRFRVRSRQYGGTTITTMSVKTVGDLLRTPSFTLLQALDPLLTFGEIELMLKRICHQCCARPVTCVALLARTCANIEKDLIQSRLQHDYHDQQPILTQSQQELSVNISNSSIGDRMRFLPTGLMSLDRRNGGADGGIRLGNITEVVGRAGAGKTQFALQLVLMAAKYNQGTMYIDTEKKLILERLRDMAAQRWSQESHVGVDGSHQQEHHSLSHGGPETCPNNPIDVSSFGFKHPDDVLRNMTVRQPNSTDELLKVLESAEEEILHRNQQASFPVRLLIVDSIAAPLKRDFGANAVPQRAATAFSIAQTLKRHAEQLHLAVIVINQVGLENRPSASSAHGLGTSRERHDQVAVRAALGTSWHHCVSTRILLDHEEDPHRDGGRADSSVDKSQWRSLSVIKSNWMASTTIPFEITPVGIVEAERADEHDVASL